LQLSPTGPNWIPQKGNNAWSGTCKNRVSLNSYSMFDFQYDIVDMQTQQMEINNQNIGIEMKILAVN
jgi:hypothetical protein